jgi:signal transduction histidine kinase
MVSHELRTPLTSVLGFASIIRKKFNGVILSGLDLNDPRIEKSSEQIKKNIDIIIAEGERLTALINDVLDLAKLEAGRIEWRMESLDPKDIIEHAVNATSSLFEQKGLELHGSLHDTEPLQDVLGDRNRLIQVMINLLSNAAKFTDSGSVAVTASNLDNMFLQISVADTGIGISKNETNEIFEKFKQSDDTRDYRPGGTGLGLPICKQIIENHGGRIWVKSVVGEGTTVSFTLPFLHANIPEAADFKKNIS